MQNQVVEALSRTKFVVESNKSTDDIKDAVQHAWHQQGLKKLYDQKIQTKTLFMTKNPKIEKILQDENISPEIKNELEREFGKKYSTIKNASNALNSCRHLNEKYHKISEQDLCLHFKNIEEYILDLEDPSYIERKDVLSDILQKINIKPVSSDSSGQKPSDKEQAFVFNLLKDNLKNYFLSKLESPSWFQPLFDKNMLKHSKEFNEEIKADIYSWDALPYLSRMASIIPEKVFALIEPLVNAIKDASIESPWLVKVIVLSISVLITAFVRWYFAML